MWENVTFQPFDGKGEAAELLSEYLGTNRSGNSQTDVLA